MTKIPFILLIMLGTLVILASYPAHAQTYTYDFVGSPVTGNPPLTVQFYDQSSGPTFAYPLHYMWHFGDGTTSTLQNPSHTYNQRGKYTVSVDISNNNYIWLSYVEKTDYIVIPQLFSFQTPSYTVWANQTSITIPVNFTGDNSTQTVQYTTSAGSATAGINYETTAGTLTYPSGTLSQNIVVPILNDGSQVGVNKVFYVSLYNASVNTSLDPNFYQASITILGNYSSSSNTNVEQPVRLTIESNMTTFYPGAIITAYQADNSLVTSAATGADGSVTFQLFYGKAYTINCFMPNKFNFNVTIMPGQNQYYIDTTSHQVVGYTEINNYLSFSININVNGLIAVSGANVNVFDGNTPVLLNQITDNAGNIVIKVLPKKYTFVVTADGYPATTRDISLLPGLYQYSIPLETSGSMWNPGNWFNWNTTGTSHTPEDVTRAIQTYASTGMIDDTTGYFALQYRDNSASTTNVTYNLYWYNPVTMRFELNQTILGNTNNANFTIPGCIGNTYRLNATSQSTIYGTVYRSVVHTYPKTWSLNLGWPTWFAGYAFLFVILCVGLMGTKRYELGIGVSLIVMATITDMLNWTKGMISHEAMFIMLSLMAVVLLVYAVAKWRREHLM